MVVTDLRLLCHREPGPLADPVDDRHGEYPTYQLELWAPVPIRKLDYLWLWSNQPRIVNLGKQRTCQHDLGGT